jgi:hypothetical protein
LRLTPHRVHPVVDAELAEFGVQVRFRHPLVPAAGWLRP